MKATVSIPAADAYGADEPFPSRPVGQDILDAVYNTVHNGPGGVTALAARMGVPANTLTHKANPNTVSHQPNPRELIAMQMFTGNFAVLHAMAEALGHTCTRATPARGGGDPVDTSMHLQSEFADFVRALSDAVRDGDGAVTSNKMRRVDHHAQELMASIGHALAMVRGRMRAAPGVLQ